MSSSTIITSGDTTPLNIQSNTLIKRRTGLNWKVLTNNIEKSQIIGESVPSNRPPAQNTSHFNNNIGSNPLTISGSSANNFRARPLKHWRKQRSYNPESYGNKNNIPKNTNNKNLLSSFDVPGGTSINKYNTLETDDCKTKCTSNKTIPNWKVAFRKTVNDEPENNKIGIFNELNRNKECSSSVPTKENVYGVPSDVYLKYTSIPVCDPPRKALNKIRTSTLINKSVNKLNNQKYYQSYNSYLKEKNKSYERNLGVKQTNEPLNELYLRSNNLVNGLHFNSYNAFRTKDCRQKVVKNYNNINYGLTSNVLTRKRWGATDSSLKILESKVNNINLAAKNANDSSVFPDQGKALANAVKYNGSYQAPYTIKSKYYSPRQCSTDLNLLRKNGSFTTGCTVSVRKDGKNVKEKIFMDRPFRQTNKLIKIPITPQLSAKEISKLH